MNLSQDSLESCINSEQLNEIRREMLEGIQPEGCQRCYNEERAGLASRRVSEIELWEDNISFLEAQNLTNSNGSLHNPGKAIIYLDLRFGNRCNLACRMCGPTESRMWYPMQETVWRTRQYKDGTRRLQLQQDQQGRWSLPDDPYDWHESPQFWTDLENHLPQIKRLYFAGGEPLLIDQHFDLLEKCIFQGFSSKITLEYNTNLLSLNKRCLDLWRHFEKVEMGISVDAVGKLNEYIRYPGKWEIFERNLKTIDQAEGSFKLWLSPTIMIYNIYHLPELMKWVIQSQFKRINRSTEGAEIITPHPLYNPQILSIQALSLQGKQIVKSHFLAEKIAAKDFIFQQNHLTEREKLWHHKRFVRLLDGYVSIMDAADLSGLLPKTREYTASLDRIHGRTLDETSSVVANLLNI